MVRIQKNRKGLAGLWHRAAGVSNALGVGNTLGVRNVLAVCGVLVLTASLVSGCGQQQNEETQSSVPAEEQTISWARPRQS